MSSACVGDLGEAGVTDLLAQIFGPVSRANVRIGIGDDAAHHRPTDLASTDLLVQGKHFRHDWSSASDVGAKAAACNLSDINAMGGQATALLLGLVLPSPTPVSWVSEFATAFADEAAKVGANVVGGDLTAGDALVIAVTALGVAPGAVVSRAGARPGDVVALCGRQGWSGAGFAVLNRGFRSPRAVVEAHRRPQPPYQAGPQAAAAGATSMIDISDGLISEARRIAGASGVALDLDVASLEIAEPLIAVGAALGVDPVQFVLTGGEDYGLLATFPADTPLPQDWRRVGQVREGEGVFVDGVAAEGLEGYRHFK